MLSSRDCLGEDGTAGVFKPVHVDVVHREDEDPVEDPMF